MLPDDPDNRLRPADPSSPMNVRPLPADPALLDRETWMVLISDYLDGTLPNSHREQINLWLAAYPDFLECYHRQMAVQQVLRGGFSVDFAEDVPDEDAPEATLPGLSSPAAMWSQLESVLKSDAEQALAATPAEFDEAFICAYLDGEVTAEEARRFEARMAYLPECRNMLADMDEVSQLYKSYGYRLESRLDTVLTPEFTQTVMTKLQQKDASFASNTLESLDDAAVESLSSYMDDELSEREKLQTAKLLEASAIHRQYLQQFYQIREDIQGLCHRLEGVAPDCWPAISEVLSAEIGKSSTRGKVIPLFPQGKGSKSSSGNSATTGDSKKHRFGGIWGASSVAAAAVAAFFLLLPPSSQVSQPDSGKLAAHVRAPGDRTAATSSLEHAEDEMSGPVGQEQGEAAQRIAQNMASESYQSSAEKLAAVQVDAREPGDGLGKLTAKKQPAIANGQKNSSIQRRLISSASAPAPVLGKSSVAYDDVSEVATDVPVGANSEVEESAYRRRSDDVIDVRTVSTRSSRMPAGSLGFAPRREARIPIAMRKAAAAPTAPIASGGKVNDDVPSAEAYLFQRSQRDIPEADLMILLGDQEQNRF